MRHKLMTAFLFFLALTSWAREQEISAWRGETVTALLDDTTELGLAPTGFSVRVGSLMPVGFSSEGDALSRIQRLDRVVWGSEVGSKRMVEVRVPTDAKPGRYPCGMLSIRVIDRVLPPASEWKYYLDLWQHPWAVSRMAHVQPFSPEHYEAMRPLWQMLAESGQKTLTVTLVDQPWNHQCRDAYRSMIGRTRRSDGTWQFDYSIFDAYVAFGRACGLGPDIACYTMCPWEYICRYWREGVGEVAVHAVPGTAAFEDFWGCFLGDFSRHLKEKGWFNDTIIALDERSPEDVRRIAEFIQKHAPGLRLSMAGNRSPSDFTGITIDSYAQILTAEHLTDAFLKEASERRRRGLVTTHYVCCWPLRPNTFLQSGASEPFWCGVFPAFSGLDGFLRWAYNSWPNDPTRDASFGNWKAGDTFLVYPDGSPSLRFLNLRAGIVAAEKIRILKEQGLFQDEIFALASRFNVSKANEGKVDFVKLQKDVLTVVNK